MTTRRTLSTLAMATFAAMGGAQTPVQTADAIAEQPILDAYTKVREFTNLKLDIAGTETVAGRQRSFSYTLYWQTGIDPRTNRPSQAKIELDQYEVQPTGMTLIRRFTADGTTLFSYDLVRHEYSAATYGWFGTRPPERYIGSDAPSLLAYINAAAPGPAGFATRLLNQVYGGELPRYTSWAPGYTPYLLDLGSRQDPIVATRTYTAYASPPPGPTPAPTGSGTTYNTSRLFVLYGQSNPNPQRSVAFQIDTFTDSSTAASYTWPTSVTFADVTRNKVIDWTMLVAPDLSTPTWAFVPYTTQALRGWRPIVAPRPATR